MPVSDLLLFFMLIAAVVLVLSPRLIHSLIALSIFSTLLTIQYVFLKAPDVAITEAALGAGLSTLVYLTAIRKTTQTGKQQQEAPHSGETETSETVKEHTMIELQDYIKPKTIHLLEGKKRDQIIQEIIHHCLPDMDPVLVNAVVHTVFSSRRSEAPLDMSLGKGFALVHSRNEECSRFRVAIGLLPERRKIYKGDKIHTVIGIVLPSRQSRQYLAFLARFGRLMYNEGVVATFEHAARLFMQGEAEQARSLLVNYVREFEKD